MTAAQNGNTGPDETENGPPRDPLGKSALFSPPVPPAAPTVTRLQPSRPARPGKAALYSVPSPPPAVAGFMFEVVCSSCKARTPVDVIGLTLLHVPFFLWVPWLRYSRFINCPACQQRTWVQVNWAGASSLT